MPTVASLQSSARGKPLVCRLLNCAPYLPNIALLRLPRSDCSGILPPTSVNEALLRHLLSFQSRSPASFPQPSPFCIHLVTTPPTPFLSRASPKLSQQATPCPTLTHLETPTPRKSTPHNSSAGEASDGADIGRRGNPADLHPCGEVQEPTCDYRRRIRMGKLGKNRRRNDDALVKRWQNRFAADLEQLVERRSIRNDDHPYRRPLPSSRRSVSSSWSKSSTL